MTKKIKLCFSVFLCIASMLSLYGCEAKKPAGDNTFDSAEYIQESQLTEAGEDIDEALSSYEKIKNYDTFLDVPTYITKVDDYYFIVDCYHNRIIYSDDLSAPLNEWYIMCSEATRPHTIASDGTVYLVEDTENNRVLIYELIDDCFINTQAIYKIGNRPHFTVYDEPSNTFYVWSSNTGELYCFRRAPDSTRVCLTEIKKIDQLSGHYVRSFSIIDGDIYFVSGASETGTPGQILVCDPDTLKVKKSYPVPNELAGMVQISKLDKMFYITVSTDLSGNQDFATIIRTSSLNDLSNGKYEDIYSRYFIGGGTPYYISKIDGSYYLTEQRIKGHSIWSFNVENGQITNVQTVF